LAPLVDSLPRRCFCTTVRAFCMNAAKTVIGIQSQPGAVAAQFMRRGR
jgi:hypothetical protein